MLVFTYLASLVFYDYEILVNPRLADYGDALWWAWMNVTTVGAAIFPVTAVGKVVCVLLPIVGMIFFSDLHGLHFTILYGKKEQQLTNRARNAIFAG